jgi:hypothetical protein
VSAICELMQPTMMDSGMESVHRLQTCFFVIALQRSNFGKLGYSKRDDDREMQERTSCSTGGTCMK